MINRRSVSLAGGLGLLVGAHLGQAQSHMKMRRVGVLFVSSESSSKPYREALAKGMSGLGWPEGQNIEYRFAYAHGDTARLDELVADLIRQKVDVIVAANTSSTAAAHRATTAIPIVMASCFDAVGAGYIGSLAKPGGNITGLTNLLDESVGKLIEFLHAIAPEARHIAVLMNGKSPVLEQFWNLIQRACTSMNLTADRVLASAPAQLPGAIEQIVRQHAQAVVVVGDALFVGERSRLQDLVKSTGLPAAYNYREFAELGGLLSYGPNLAAGFRYSAKFVDKILKGAKPADLPVEQPTTFELVINVKTAKAIGLTIPQSLLLRADEVIE